MKKALAVMAKILVLCVCVYASHRLSTYQGFFYFQVVALCFSCGSLFSGNSGKRYFTDIDYPVKCVLAV